VGKKVTVLFWNINKKDLKEPIKRLVELHDVDILLLAVCTTAITDILSSLNAERSDYFFSPGLCEKIKVFTRFAVELTRPVYEEERLTIRRLTLPMSVDVLLAVLHFPSKVRWTEEDQMVECVRLINAIKLTENDIGHERTLLIGDLNMNPFEKAMVAAGGLNSVMDRNVAKKRRRVVQGRAYPFFYNPMWSFLGDLSRGKVPGTHYYDSSGVQINYHWNMFDQVLIRPDLIDNFDLTDLDILVDDGNVQFVHATGRINNDISDHLPLKFSINL
jgi:endonuclease/exonuclease/phosphatase family metal-dependent hydrolase